MRRRLSCVSWLTLGHSIGSEAGPAVVEALVVGTPSVSELVVVGESVCSGALMNSCAGRNLLQQDIGIVNWQSPFSVAKR